MRSVFFPHHIQAESLLHPITQQFILLRDTVSYYASSSSPGTSHPEHPPPSGGGFLGGLGAEGCIKCLKQDQLMGWIDLRVQREVGDMRLQLNSLNDQVVIVSIEFLMSFEQYKH